MHGDYELVIPVHCISLVEWYMPFNNNGLLVTSKLCTYYSAVGSTEFVLKLHVAFSCRNIPCTALKASASRAGGLVDVMIYVASGALDISLCFDRCMYYPAEHMQTDI